MLQLDWNATVNAIRESLNRAQFQNWLQPVEFIRADEYKIVLGVPSRFHESWIRDNYSGQISEAIRNQCGTDLQLEFEILKANAAGQIPASAKSQAPAIQTPVLNLPSLPQAESVIPQQDPIQFAEPNPVEAKTGRTETSFWPKFSMPFMELEFNHVAYQCSQLFVENEALVVHPLVLVGAVGMGKTHLMTEVGELFLKKNPDLCIRYTTAEMFTNELFQSNVTKSWGDFRKKYGAEPDILLFDDIGQLATRPKSQEMLLHFFNDLALRGGRIVFTSSVLPHQLEGFLEPLKSRLLSGLIAEIKSPNFEEQVALLAQVADHNQMDVEVPVLRSLASQGAKDVRELIGTLVRTHLHARLQNQKLDSDFLVRESPTLETKKAVTVCEIISLVEHNFGVPRDELVSKSRKGNTNWARQVGMFLARQFTLLPLEEIGRAFGRDHATVIHAFQKVSEAIEKQPTKKYEVDFLRQKLQARAPRLSDSQPF